jgi:hypothetical protein
VAARNGISADDSDDNDDCTNDDQHFPPATPNKTTAPALCGSGVKMGLTSLSGALSGQGGGWRGAM